MLSVVEKFISINGEGAHAESLRHLSVLGAATLTAPTATQNGQTAAAHLPKNIHPSSLQTG